MPGKIVIPRSATAGIVNILSSTCICSYISRRIRILKEPKNSLIKQYTRLLELDGVGLEFEDSAIEAIADKALERKTGARGLRI